MLPIQPALYELLRDDPAIDAIVNGRVFPLKAPQRVRDVTMLVFGRPPGDNRVRHQRIDGSAYSGLTTSTFHFVSIVSGYGMEAYTKAAQLDAAVFQKLQGYMGTVTQGSPEESVDISGILATNYVAEGYDEERNETFITSEFTVAHAEPTPPVTEDEVIIS